MAGEGTPPTIESSENRAGADMAAGGGLPADGQDRGATADAGGMKARRKWARASGEVAARWPTWRHQGSPGARGMLVHARR